MIDVLPAFEAFWCLICIGRMAVTGVTQAGGPLRPRTSPGGAREREPDRVALSNTT